MFHVKVKLGESKVDGIGLFSDQDIMAGQKIYTPNPLLDLKISEPEFKWLTDDEKSTIEHYGYLDKNDGMWHYAFDDIKFCNHSNDGNLTLQEGVLVAKRHIPSGEELTQDYNEFEKLRFDN